MFLAGTPLVERARGDFGDELIVLTSCGGMGGMLAKFGEEIGTQEDTAS